MKFAPIAKLLQLFGLKDAGNAPTAPTAPARNLSLIDFLTTDPRASFEALGKEFKRQHTTAPKTLIRELDELCHEIAMEKHKMIHAEKDVPFTTDAAKAREVAQAQMNPKPSKLETANDVVQATKHDYGKMQVHLIPARAYQAVMDEWRAFLEPPQESKVVPDYAWLAMSLLQDFKSGNGGTNILARAGVCTMFALGNAATPIPGASPTRAARSDWIWAKHEVSKVFVYGAAKYDVGNWHSGNGFKWSRLLSAAERHLDSHFAGELFDTESKFYHLAHAMCCILMLLEHIITRHGEDDRHPAQYKYIPL